MNLRGRGWEMFMSFGLIEIVLLAEFEMSLLCPRCKLNRICVILFVETWYELICSYASAIELLERGEKFMESSMLDE